jgi:hypothetical protein
MILQCLRRISIKASQGNSPSRLAKLVPIVNITEMHKWARLLKHQSSITIYHLLTKENKLPFFVSIRRKQTEFAVLIFVRRK